MSSVVERAQALQVILWGVVGPGAIAPGFADAIQRADGGTIAAVASRLTGTGGRLLRHRPSSVCEPPKW